tara:strand:- start:9 stop:326 length:318 start_codon:yes stop_codon:yes gene_type:complete
MDERICLDVAGNFYNLCSNLGLLWKNAAMPAIWGHRMNDDESHQQQLERQRQEEPLDKVEIIERLRQAESILHPLFESKEGVSRYALFCQNMLSILRQKQSQLRK